MGDLLVGRLITKSRLEELQGGTFTISNGGVYGSMLSTPIINPPQSGILGLHAIQERPVAVDGQVVVRPMMYVALSYDHRIVDGREAVTFLKRIKEMIRRSYVCWSVSVDLKIFLFAILWSLFEECLGRLMVLA